MGPAAPRLGGRRPRRRLCFPPPVEGCPGPAFIILLLLIPGLDHRPDCFVFPCGPDALVLTSHRRSADLPKGWSAIENDVQSILTPGVVGREGPSRKRGRWEQHDVPMKRLVAQGGMTSSFAHPSIRFRDSSIWDAAGSTAATSICSRLKVSLRPPMYRVWRPRLSRTLPRPRNRQLGRANGLSLVSRSLTGCAEFSDTNFCSAMESRTASTAIRIKPRVGRSTVRYCWAWRHSATAGWAL
jgi:hypothetical protein